MTDKQTIGAALTVTADLIGWDLKESAMRAMAARLERYPVPDVLGALDRCACECKYKLTLADVIERLPPSPESITADQAWAIAVKSKLWADDATIVLPAAIAGAFIDYALPLWQMGDQVAARRAFIDSFDGLRSEVGMGAWISYGDNPEHRRTAIVEAMANGFIPRADGESRLEALGEPPPDNEWTRALEGVAAMPQLEGAS